MIPVATEMDILTCLRCAAAAVRRALLAATAFLVVVPLAMSSAAASQAPRWNILFVFADDQTHRTVSAYPQAWPWLRTPHIDRLAAEGVRFEHAYSGPWCTPSRAMMM